MINRGVGEQYVERALFLDAPFRHSIYEASQRYSQLDCGCRYDLGRDLLIFCSEDHQAKREL